MRMRSHGYEGKSKLREIILASKMFLLENLLQFLFNTWISNKNSNDILKKLGLNFQRT